MNRFFSIVLLLCFAAPVCRAQQGLGNYRSGFVQQNGVVSASFAGGDLRLVFYNNDVFRVRCSWTRAFAPDEPLMLTGKPDNRSLRVTATDQRDHFLVQTTRLRLKVFKAPYRLEVYNIEGKLMSQDAGGGTYTAGDTVACTKTLYADEHFFGFGERMDFLDRRSKLLKLDVGRGKGLPHAVGAYNILEANYCPVPFFMSTRGYGIFFNTAYPTHWDMGATRSDRYRFAATGGELDYFFINGPAFPAILDHYTMLTGKAPLMPRYAYGLHLGTYSGGTWGYEHLTSDAYVVALARRMREMGLPVDLLWLDSTWRIFGNVGGKGATSFEWRETFRNPRAMFDSLYAMGYNMVGLHLRPRFDNGNRIKLLDTAQQLGFTYPEGNYAGEFVNFFDSNAVNFWWQHGVKRVAELGARFLKTDEGSAFGALANESDKVGPTGRDVPRLHNLFPLAYAKAPYEKFQQFNKVRGLNHTREGYAGIQRYPFIFAGDWPSEWQYFAPVIKAGLNIGASGVGHWAHCMGGFEHVADPELYIRWVQFGMFSPVAMVFGMEHPTYKEPWAYGDTALRNFRIYDSLRYRLLPYIYSSAWQQHRTGMPLMRALVLAHQGDENVYEIGDQYLFGDNLLVCPVTTKGAQTRTVYLPEGEWYDYWTGKAYNGRRYIHVETPLLQMPLFVKAGSALPMQPLVPFIGADAGKELLLDIFPGNGSFTLYHDDGKSQQYEQGVFATTVIRVAASQQNLVISAGKPQGRYQPKPQTYNLRVHLATAPKVVLVNGAAIRQAQEGSGSWRFDADKKILYIETDLSTATGLNVTVQR